MDLWRLIAGKDKRRLALVQATVAGMAILIILAIMLESGAAASQSGQEMELKQNNGRAWELNEDGNGHLWISDYGGSEIWHLNPSTGVYTIYNHLTGASDGRLDANGDLWWADFDNHRFGRLDLDTDVRTTWPLTGEIQGEVIGLNFDDQGRVWIPDSAQDSLYRFDPGNDEFCHYQLPNNSASPYIESHGGYLWLADDLRTYIYRIDPDDGSYTQWNYERVSTSQGMTFDDNGHLWWGGYIRRSALFRLDPNSPFVTYYYLPSGTSQPAMVDAHHGVIWFSDHTGQFGRLAPEMATGLTVNAKMKSDVLPFECYQDWSPIGSNNTVKSTSSASWVANTYSMTSSADGWSLYQLPQDTEDWGPWGIRARSDGVWVVDQERQRLVHVAWQNLYVPFLVK
jgi:streptogramin lyase